MAKLKPIQLIAAVCVAIACFAALGSVYFWSKLEDLHAQEYVAALNRNEQRATQMSEAATQLFDGTVRSVDTALQYLRDVYEKDRAGFDKAVHIVLANYPAGMLDMVVVTDAGGYVSYSSAGTPQRVYLGDREHIAVHAHSTQDQLYISRPVQGRIGNAVMVPLSRPMQSRGKFAGVITIPLRPQYFADKFVALQVVPDDLLAVVRADGSFLARNHKLAEALQTQLPPDRPFLKAQPGMSGIFRDVSHVDKVPMVFSWRRLHQWPVSIVVAVNENTELQSLQRRQTGERHRTQAAIVLLLIASVGVAVLLYRFAGKSELLTESESRFRHFFEKNGSVMLLIDPKDGRIINANATAAHFYGYPQKQLLRMKIGQINTLTPQEVAEEMAHAQREERNYFNFSHRLANGEVRPVEVYSTPISIDQHVFLFSIVNDMTARRKMEAERDLLAIAVEQSPTSIVVARPDGSIEYVNAAFTHTTGYTREEALGKNPRMLKSGTTSDAEYTAMWERLSNGLPWKGTFRNLRKDGSSYWESAHISPVTDASGKITHYLGVKENITERRMAEEKMKQLQAHLQAGHDLLERLSENLPGVMYQYRLYPDGHTCFPYASQGLVDIYGVTPEEVALDGAAVRDRLHPDDLEQILATIKTSADTLTPWRLDYRVVIPQYGVRWLSGAANPIRLDDGSVLWHGFIKDVTDRKMLEQVVLDRNRDMNTILENSSVGITFVKGRSLVWANQRMGEIFGYAKEDLQNLNTRAFYPSDEAYEEIGRDGYATLQRDERYVSERQMVTRSGQLIWVRISGKGVDARNLDEGTIWIFEDITAQKDVETRLRLAANVFTHAREGIMITDAAGSIVDVNETFCAITGYTRDEVLGQNPRMLKSGVQSADFYASIWKSLLEKDHWYGEIWNRRKNGEVFAEMQTISAIRDAQGVTQHYLSLFSDITPLKMHEQELERIAHYDALTRLPNRVLLADRLRQGLLQSQRHNHSLAVVFLDLDGFKTVNDLYGHAAGDRLLIEISQRMKGALREGDTLSRIGGDEFVAILSDLEKVQNCEPVLARMLQAASAPVVHDGHILQVSASMGVTLYPQDGEDADLLMRHADQAMYTAKQAGKNRYHMFDVAQDAALKIRRETVEHIQRALTDGEFVLYYQPKVELQSGKLVGMEALIRWRHPARGLLQPAEFLPIIEDHAFSIELGEWVLLTALTQISQWRDAGLHIAVSVNVGARQLQHERFIERLRNLLRRFPDLPTGQLQIEVLETSALQDLHKVGATMNECQAMGVSFALDDFGTGYSSLTYLKHLPAAMLKIDQSFIRDMLKVESDLAIVNGVIGLARAFGREVIAEGVETQDHARLLLSLGCEMAQGYGIARPMPAEEVAGWLQMWQERTSWSA